VRVRTALFRLAGVRVGDGSVFAGRVWIGGGPHPQANLTIGRNCFVNDDVRLDTLGPVSIGDRVDIGHGVAVITSTHELGHGARRAGRNAAGPVIVGHGSWICAGAMILPGVTVGDGAVVAAGAVVTASVAPDTLVGGSPARQLRHLEAPPAPAQGREA
jgi:acetyltransferase-like isoleucine patch superfamily enzyme